MLITFFLYGISILLFNKLLNSLGYFFVVIATFFLLVAIDYSKRESIDPFKMLFFGILGSLTT